MLGASPPRIVSTHHGIQFGWLTRFGGKSPRGWNEPCLCEWVLPSSSPGPTKSRSQLLKHVLRRIGTHDDGCNRRRSYEQLSTRIGPGPDLRFFWFVRGVGVRALLGRFLYRGCPQPETISDRGFLNFSRLGPVRGAPDNCSGNPQASLTGKASAS